jgi:tetratricopeptide (TPR) repeat protein
MLAYYAEALLMLYDSTRHFPLLQEAESLAELALEREEKENICSSEPSLAYALCQFEKGNYFNEFFYFESAQELLQKTVAIYPRSAHSWYALALVTSHLALQERDEAEMKEAILCFLLASRSVISTYPHFWNSWGLSLLTLGDLTEDSVVVEDACIKFEIAIELSNSAETDWIFNLGCALDLLGYLREEEELHEYALELFKHVEREDPTLYEVILQQAVVYRHLGDMRDSMNEYARSLECLNRYLREEEEDEFAWAELGLVHLYKAQKEMREDEKVFSPSLSQAEDAFHRALYFGNPGAYYHLACLYTYVKNFPEAMECLWKAEEEEALPPLNDILEEEMLMPLFSTRAFTQFLHEILSCLEFTESVDEEFL